MGFSKEVKEQALLACKRHCVLCEKSKGLAMECHHIIPKSKGGDDSFGNCIPVCFDCHQEIGSYNPKHPKGNIFSEFELKQRRDDFYTRVKKGEFPKQDSNSTQIKYISSIKDCDIEIIDEIKKVFESNNLKYYLTEYDLGNDFDNRVFEPLNTLSWKKDDPNFLFVDIDLEHCKINLLESVDKFIDYKCENTFTTKLGTKAIKTWKNYNYTDKETYKINKKFNDLANDIWSNYHKLIKTYKRKV